MRERFVSIRGLNVCLCEWGQVGDPIVICLHGYLDQGAAWARVGERFAEQGFHFIAPDARGHGCSDHAPEGSDYHFPDYLSDLDGLLDELDLSEIFLIGHSMGGTVASLYAGVRPERITALGVVEGLGPPEEDLSSLADKIRLHLDQIRSLKPHRVMKDTAAAAERLRRLSPGLSTEFSESLSARSTVEVDGGVVWRWDPLHRTRIPSVFSKESYIAALRRITAPVALVYGDAGWYKFPDLPEREAALKDFKRHTLPGGHNLHIDAPEAMADIFIDAFRSIRS